MFHRRKRTKTHFLDNSDLGEPDLAKHLFRQECAYFIYNAMSFNLEQFQLNILTPEDDFEFREMNEQNNFEQMDAAEKYLFMRGEQGRLQSLYLQMPQLQNDKQTAILNQLISSIRSAMYSVKFVKDIQSNIENLSESSKSIKYNFYMHLRVDTTAFCTPLHSLVKSESANLFSDLESLFKKTEMEYNSSLDKFFKDALKSTIEDSEITTILNFNREIFISNKALLIAVKDYLLD